MIEQKIRVKMLSTQSGAEDGINIKTYLKDSVHEMGKSLASCFISDRSCIEVDEKNKPLKKKSTNPVEENK